ncbi:hypothetical protein BTR23_04435 [Alkalihalophilus pseudofirmus]|uniref:hypothetical protein n=1 Tax=Alkalihalobacterium alkalinitrilicum TaxID=427920 RepID=UPI00094D81F2|nr:hypothetical protein [Alkalihalobacterium alkalinitrilicum]OLO40727.1 hypothetical protein BTR23_04435 [Alkalihalophilus pseudofirmus]
MRQHISYLLLTTFLFTSGCWSSAATTNPLATDNTEYMTVLFSNEESLLEEASFYDALLEMQRLFPDKHFPFQIVYASERNVIRYFNVNTYPTLMVLSGDDIHLVIEGKHSKEDIIDMLTSTLEMKDKEVSFHIHQ